MIFTRLEKLFYIVPFELHFFSKTNFCGKYYLLSSWCFRFFALCYHPFRTSWCKLSFPGSVVRREFVDIVIVQYN